MRDDPLGGTFVVDLTTGLAGSYCAKLLASAGAEVVLVEEGGPHPLRSWSCSGSVPVGGTGALFEYLRGGQRSVTTTGDALLAAADLILVEPGCPFGEPASLRERFPTAVVVAISPFGLEGPLVGVPWSELTLQAIGGSLGTRGRRTGSPVQMGGHTTEWVSGLYAAVGALGAWMSVRGTGAGELVDVSMLEVGNTTSALFNDVMYALRGSPPIETLPIARSFETPSIEPTSDGYVGFNTNTRTQFESFALLIERPDLLEDMAFAAASAREQGWDEWNTLVHAWTTQHTTAEIVEAAAALRIPVAPVGDAESILALDHLRERAVYRPHPAGGFAVPRRPWLVDGESGPLPQRAPARGEADADDVVVGRTTSARLVLNGEAARLPLDGIRVLDLTAWWAGPAATGMLAALGADVIHVESVGHPDGMRMSGGMFADQPQWWERSAMYLQANANKRGITLDLGTVAGREVLLRLVEHADMLVENFTPRVLEQMGLTWDVLHAANPQLIMVRMPAFGLDGPWRDRPGFAQTMEQLTGLAWVTGFAEDQPRIQRGPCDPNAGMHAAFAMMAAVLRRERTGEGFHLEVPMVEAALNIAAETVIEWTAYGNRLARIGNRSHRAAPQGVYRCAGDSDDWVAVSVLTDEQWSGLCSVIGLDPGRFPTHADRWAAHDELDAVLSEWAAGRVVGDAVPALFAVGVPAAPMCDPRLTASTPQFVHRGFIEHVEHPVIGTVPLSGMPFRWESVERWIRTPPPTIGQHNDEVLVGLAGCTPEELATLTEAGVIGTRPKGL